MPRDHYKTTIFSEGAPMWWALPVSSKDEDLFTQAGYSDTFIKWMKRAHNQDTRTLLVSENITNAIKIGSRIEKHYRNNDLFLWLFPEIKPDSSCTWRSDSMTHKRSSQAQPHGEGTFDYLGVGGALQSRHYDRIIQDDLVGRKALNSDAVMDDTINYHQLLVGGFDSDGTSLNDEIVVGNRWAEDDLNSHIREQEPDYNIISHSALGGCCSEHPSGVPIFPEEFSVEKLESFKHRLGPYLFSCQFENQPINPSTRHFKDEWLRFYSFRVSEDVKIEHSVHNGVIIPDIDPLQLSRYMVVDPNHAGAEGRCHHAITITGIYHSLDGKSLRIYLLDAWAESAAFESFIDTIYRLADKWLLNSFWLETVAGQKYLKFHIETQNLRDKRFLIVNELKLDRSKNAKFNRIESLTPYFYRGEVYVRREQTRFLTEYQKYSRNYHGPIDILDTLGYAPQIWDSTVYNGEEWSRADELRQDLLTGVGVTGY